MKRTLLFLVMAATAHVGAQGVTDAMIADDANTPTTLSWGMGTQGQRYSSLNQVNAKSISKLGCRCGRCRLAARSSGRNPSPWSRARCS
ncbi:MAG: hypothetical protein R3E42_09535 [Burkholderiaceae bacterium]